MGLASTHKRRGQTALEFLTSYGWAILLIGVAIAVIAIFTNSRPTYSYLPSECSIQPSLPCMGAIVSAYNSSSSINFTVSFRNDLGQPIEFASNGINLTVSNLGSNGKSNYLGSCKPQIVSGGGTVICSVSIPGTVEPLIGTKVQTYFTLYYSTCQDSECTGNYVTSGQALQQLSPPNKKFYTLTFISSPNDGYIYLQGIKYYNGTIVFLQGGSYTVYSSPSNGYSFSSWSIMGSSLSSNSAQTTVLSLSANSTITANLAKV